MTGENDMNMKSDTFRKKDDTVLFDRINAAVRETRIAEIERNLTKAPSPSSRFVTWIMKSAALLLPAVGLTFLLMHLSRPEGVRIYNAYFQPYTATEISGIYRDHSSEFSTAATWYSEGKYRLALDIFRKLAVEKPGDIQSRLLLAVCLMEENRFGEAETVLDEILQHTPGMYTAEATWYLTLLCIRAEKYEPALQLLDGLKDSAFLFSSAVEPLQKKISRSQNHNGKNQPH